MEIEGKPVTNQKSSGRCWLFAVLNCMRIPMMKEYNLDECELSQAYLFYCDKIERTNFYLNNVVETYKRGEKVDGRLMSFILSVRNFLIKNYPLFLVHSISPYYQELYLLFYAM